MAWFRVQRTSAEQGVVQEERESHPNRHVRQRMLALWLPHCGLTREKAATILGVGRISVQGWVAAYRQGGLDGLRRWEVEGPQSERVAYPDLIRASLAKEPVRTVAEARDRIQKLTGLRRGLSQTRTFLKGLGLKWQRVPGGPGGPGGPGAAQSWKSTSKNRLSCTAPSGSRGPTTPPPGGGGAGPRLLRGRCPLRVRHVPVLPGVDPAGARAGGVRPPTVQRIGGVERDQRVNWGA